MDEIIPLDDLLLLEGEYSLVLPWQMLTSLRGFSFLCEMCYDIGYSLLSQLPVNIYIYLVILHIHSHDKQAKGAPFLGQFNS